MQERSHLHKRYKVSSVHLVSLSGRDTEIGLRARGYVHARDKTAHQRCVDISSVSSKACQLTHASISGVCLPAGDGSASVGAKLSMTMSPAYEESN